MPLPIVNKLSSDGRVRFYNWARTFTNVSTGFYVPKNEDQLRDIIVEANTKRKHVRVVGAGHSPSDIVCSTGYLVSLDKMNKMVSFDPESQTVTVQAGTRYDQLQKVLEKLGYSLPIVGSISSTSVAGIMSTCTHGSSLQHQVLPGYIESLRLMLADGSIVTCSRTRQKDVFSAAQVSLGALGVVVDLTVRVVPAFDLVATESSIPISTLFEKWKANELWQAAEFVRVHVFPYANRAVVWNANKVIPGSVPHTSKPSKFQLKFTSFMYENLLYIGNLFPRFMPTLQRLAYHFFYGWRTDHLSTAVGPGFDIMQMFCFFSQHVAEYSVPLDTASDALERVINYTIGPALEQKIYTHQPLEVRVAAPTPEDECWLSTASKVPTCFIECIMYRPYHRNVKYESYFNSFEEIMCDYNGKPHWAKEFNLNKKQLLELHPNLSKWLNLRNLMDPNRVFWNNYMRRHFS
ncbi:D-arabinono-1,4-lactone oxidase [Schizosaccharomyces osmophilus]|uniref:D-arabinono-1,4-lactone oxidase n=1 Tax=Schizosaccharomyces osmophilus TaxID=2545709 RepID=A0AAE9WD39_9SCHI|nr:D-arabinono-1,4-lactone oxidase [Schizosaccharomyces osmophilus]WBW73344.1 D-arabinono-1,4-lactone oxidase [Schizosaccharomyces osmophilus]